MRPSVRKPRWWVLDAIFALMLGLIAFNAWISRAGRGRPWVLLLIVFAGYGVVGLWLAANRSDLSQPGDTARDAQAAPLYAQQARSRPLHTGGADYPSDDRRSRRALPASGTPLLGADPPQEEAAQAQSSK